MSEVPTRRSRRTDSPSKGDVKEQQLLAAAQRLLTAGRFADASVADLAEEAGLSRAAFYFYFPSKQALLGSVVTEAVRAFNGRLTEELAGSEDRPPAAVVAATVHAAADLWWDHRAAMVANVELSMAMPEMYRQNMAGIAMVAQPTIALLRRHGTVPEAGDAGEAEQLVRALILMTERSFYDLARHDTHRADYDALAHRLTRIWRRAFGIGVG